MADVTSKVAAIRNATYGNEVREGIASGIENINTEVIATTGRQTTLEGTQGILQSQFSNVVTNATATDPSSVEIVAARLGEVDLPTKIGQIDSSLAKKTSKTYVDTLAQSITSGSPKGIYGALSNITTAFPTGNTNIYLTSGDGNWNYWNGTAWVAGGVYQSILSSEFPATNLVKNGDFSSGTTDWSSQDTSLLASNNTLVGTGLGNLPFIRVFSGTTNRRLTGVTNDKIYGRVLLQILDNVCKSVDMTIQSGTTGYVDILELKTPVNNVWNTISNIVSIPANANGINLGVAFHADYNNATEQLNKTLNIKYSLLINLTATFGSGNEPTKTEMDEILSNFSNSWFNETKSPLIDNKGLYELLNEIKLSGETIEYNNRVWGNATKMRYAGHRGFPANAPESSLPSYEESGKAGHGYFESDINSTSDGKFIIMHDATVDRTTNGTGNVKDLTLSQIKSYNIDVGVNIELYPSLKVPTLEEYLTVCRKWGAIPLMQIDKLPNNLESPEYNNFLQILKNYGYEESAIVVAIDVNRLNKMRSFSKKVHLNYLISYLGTAVINTAISIGNCSIAFNKDSGALDQNAINYAHNNGIHVNAFTVNDRVTADLFLQQGVDLLTTDTLKFEA